MRDDEPLADACPALSLDSARTVGEHALGIRVQLEVRVLGELEVLVGRTDHTPTGRFPRAVLSILVVRLGQVVHTDTLIDALWKGSPPKSARSSLRVHISKVRHAVGIDDLLVTTEHGYRLQADPQTIDAYRFELGAREGRRLLHSGLHQAAIETLRAALDEWRDSPYEDGRELPLLSSEADRLKAMRSEAQVDLAAAQLESTGSPPDVEAFERLVASDPLDERRWSLLMRGLYLQGRQADALGAYRRASQFLGEELGLEPGPELRALEEQILLHAPELSPARPSVVVALPGFATEIVGRSEQAATLAKRLGARRLVTVTGLGGVGKTRLAVAAAHAAADDFSDGAVFVPLDPVVSDGLVADAVATALGMPAESAPIEAAVAHLARREIVLVLDNCEHVVDGVAGLVVRLQADCPGVGLLCTSRIPIGVTGETTVPVNPLSVPSPGQEFATPDELLRFESVALFCDRARMARPDFSIDAENGHVVVEIVRRLAGIPLSIEIAAAKSDVLNPADILDRLDASSSILHSDRRDRPDRHRSMADAVAWSLDLLDESAETLFKRMAVFLSPVTSDAIEAVCTDDLITAAAVHGSLAALTRSSLVTVDLDGTRARYAQLPPIREVAAHLLDTEEPQMRARHVEYFAALASREVQHVGGPDEAWSFQRLTSALNELRTALGHAATDRSAAGRQMCIDLGSFWIRSGRTAEGRSWVARFLDADDSSPAVTASLLHLAGSLALVEQDFDAAHDALKRALDLRRDLGASRDLGMTLSNLGGLANGRAEYEQAESLFREALAAFRAAGFRRGEAAAHLNLGLAMLNTGEAAAAAEELQLAVDGFRRVGDRAEEAHGLTRLGFAHSELGDLARSGACRLAAHRIYETLGRAADIAYSHMNLAAHHLETTELDEAKQHAAASAVLSLAEHLERWWVPGLLELAAGIALTDGSPDQGARFLGCASAHRRAHDLPLPEAVKTYRDATRSRIEQTLGRERFLIEFEVGGTGTLAEGLRSVAAWE